MTKPARKPVDRFPDVDRIVAEARLAVREALAEHRRAGNPFAVWRDGKVVWIPPEKVPVDVTGRTKSPTRR